MHHHEIKTTIAIVVDESGAGGPTRRLHTGRARHVCKGTVPVVVIENVAASTGRVIRYVQIDIAVIVIIACSHAHALAAVTDAGLLGDIGEGEFAAGNQVIAEQPVARLPAVRQGDHRFSGLWPRGALYQVEIQVSVVVVVDQRGARSHNLRQEKLAGGPGELPEVQPGLLGDVFKRSGVLTRGLARG